MSKITLVIACLAFVGCASSPVPADKLAKTTASIKSAEELNADQEPNAALHLRLAREQLASAKKLMEDSDNERAGYVLDRAGADADAAREIARAKMSKIEVEKYKEQVQEQKTKLGGGQ